MPTSRLQTLCRRSGHAFGSRKAVAAPSRLGPRHCVQSWPETVRAKNKTMRVYKGTGCSDCQSRDKCTKRKDGIRYIKMYPYEVERDAMVAKMKTPHAQGVYKLRQQIVEPAIGDIKENQGLRAFLARGLQGAKTEINLACAARNLRKIWISLKKKEENGGEKVKTRGQIPSPLSSSVMYQFC